MALMYPWATREYLLWNMSIGQIIYYNNKGISIRNGNEEKPKTLADLPVEKLRKMRDDNRAQVELEKRLEKEKELKEQYGDIG